MDTWEWAATALIAVIAIAAAISMRNHRRLRQRHAALHHLLDNADRLESDLVECRQRLDRAHAVMAITPDTPVAGESDARKAVDAGLRSLLEHRLWIRDHSVHASQRELDDAVTALTRARASLEPQLRALDHAQRELEQAVRDHIERD